MSSSSGAGAGAGSSDAVAAGRGVKRAREEGAGAGAGSGSSSAAAAAPPPPQLPAPSSFSAAGVAQDVAGAIGPHVTSWLPTASLTLQWHDGVGEYGGSGMTVPAAAGEALCSRAVLGDSFVDQRTVARKFVVTKKAGGVFVISRSYFGVFYKSPTELPAVRAAAAAAVAADASLSLTFSEETLPLIEGRTNQEFIVSERPQHTASEARARAALDAVLAQLDSRDAYRPTLTVRTDDLVVRIRVSSFPVGILQFDTSAADDDDDGDEPQYFTEGDFDDLNPALLNSSKRAAVELMLASAARQRAASAAKIAKAVALFFAAET
jgi:hypothetical protein